MDSSWVYVRSVACCVAALFGAVGTAGCAGEEEPTSVEGSTFGEPTGTDSSGAVGSTGTLDDGSSEGSESDGSSSEGSEPGDAVHEPVCLHYECYVECTRDIDSEDDEGNACTCTAASEPEGIITCQLPRPCGTNDYLCTVQALRWGVVGAYRWSVGAEHTSITEHEIHVLGDGRVRGSDDTFTERSCCSGTGTNFVTQRWFPFEVAPPDDPNWQQCLAQANELGSIWDELPDCANLAVLSIDACTGTPLSACPIVPEPPRLDAPCEASCPMAGDGVCDESAGTGLCPDGCDPIDCA